MLVCLVVSFNSTNERPVYNSALEICSEERRFIENRIAEDCPCQIGAIETSVRQIGPGKCCLAHPGSSEIGFAQIRVSQVGLYRQTASRKSP